MRAIIAFLAGTVFFASLESGASACKATPWPFSRAQEKSSIVKLFHSVERQALIEYLFGEVTSPKEGPLAYYLLTYLMHTEESEHLSGFLETLKWGSELNDENSVSRKLKLEEVCDLYSKALALVDREPTSVVKPALKPLAKPEKSTPGKKSGR